MSVFISYSRQDFQFAAGLYRDLEAAGLDPWLDVVKIPYGSNWQDEVGGAVAGCSAFILVVSPWSLRSLSVRDEWRMAIQLGKPILLLVMQSVEPDTVQQALDEVFEGLEAQPVNWVDVRSHPLKSGVYVSDWLKSKLEVQRGALPSPGKAWRLDWGEQPRSVVWMGAIFLAEIITSILGGVGVILWLLNQPVFNLVFSAYRPDTVSGWNSFSVFLLTRAFVLAIPLVFATMMIALGVIELWHLPAMLHRQRMRIVALLSMFLLTLPLAALVVLLPAIREFLLSVLSFYTEQTLPSFDLLSRMMAGLVALFLLGLVIVINSKELQRWFPVFSGKPVQDELPISQNGVMATVSSQVQQVELHPGQSVQVIFAAADAPFGELILDILQKEGFEPHTDEKRPGDGAAVLVMSPWSVRDETCRARWRSALGEGLPLLPLLLEPTHIPLELRRLNWIDAQAEFDRMRHNLLNILRNSRVPWFKKGEISIPAPRTSETGAVPGQVGWVMVLNGLISPILVWLTVCLLVPTATWRLAQFDLLQWLSCAALLMVAYLQYRFVMRFLDRRLSRHALFASLLAALLFKVLLILVFWWEVAYALWVPLENIPIIVIGYDFAAIGLMSVLPDVRRWAPAGWWFGKGYRTRSADVWIMMLLLFFVLIAPTWFGGAPELLTKGGAVEGSVSLLARILPQGGEQSWQVAVNEGSVAMVVVEPISDSLVRGLEVKTAPPSAGKIFTVSGLLRAAYQYGAGPLVMQIFAPAPGGTYQVLVRQRPAQVLAGQCAPNGWQQELEGNWRVIQFPAQAGQTLVVHVWALEPDPTLAVVLFGPDGEALAGDLNDQDLPNLSLTFRAERSGTYGFVAVTPGRYRIEIKCEN